MPKKDGGTRRQGHEGGQRAGPGRPFIEKVAGAVGKVIPEHLLPTVFAGVVVAALLLLILTIVGFSRDPGEVARRRVEKLKAEIVRLGDGLKEERVAHSEARGAKKGLERTREQLSRLEDDRKRLAGQVKDLTQRLGEAREGRKKLDRERGELRRQAENDGRAALKERDAALRDSKVTTDRLAAAETRLKELQKEYNELRAEKDEAKKVHESARVAFESIVDNVDGIDDPEKKLEALERLRALSRLDLAGTRYMEKLDGMVSRQKGLLEDEKRRAREEAKREARAIYESVMKAVKRHREAYEENLKRLKEAYARIEGTRWGEKLKKLIESSEGTLADDCARVLYEKLVSRVRLNPKSYDENLALAAEIKPGITQRYEKAFAKQVAGVERDKLDTAGRAALSEARAHIASNPKDHEGNIAALREFLKRARGSRHEDKLADMIERERKMLLRAGK